jgi:hypothetical protein
LEHQRDEVAGDEDPGVVSGLYFAPFLSEGENEVFQCEVNTCCNERWREYEARDLDSEAEGAILGRQSAPNLTMTVTTPFKTDES